MRHHFQIIICLLIILAGETSAANGCVCRDQDSAPWSVTRKQLPILHQNSPSKKIKPQYAHLQRVLKLIVDSSSFLNDTTGISSLPVLPPLCGDEFHVEDYHLCDLNSDGKKDLIFSGPCNPYIQTQFYFNTGSGFELGFECAGRVVYLEQDSLITHVYILKEACCCDEYHTFTEATIDTHSLVHAQTIQYHSNTAIVVSDTIQSRIMEGTIRTTPMVDDTSYTDECSGEIRIGNQIETITISSVIVVAQEGDWSLIIHHRSGNWSCMGWMK